MKLNIDPNVIGPGYWKYFHTRAKNATTDKKIHEFIEDLNELRTTFPCKTCQKHINEYFDRHPISLFINKTDEKGNRIGMFEYMWLFHNEVNKRLNKPIVSFSDAIEMHSDNPSYILCSSHCNEDLHDTNITSPIIYDTTINKSKFPYFKRKH